MTLPVRWTLLFLALALPACDASRTSLFPVAAVGTPLDTSMAYVDPMGPQVVLVDTVAPTPTVRIAKLPSAPGATIPTADGSKLLLLVPANDALISVGDGDAKLTQYDLGAPYDGLVASDDGARAITFFTAGGSGGVFQNANELAVVNLSGKPGKSNPKTRTVRSFGTAPDAVSISPPIKLGNVETRVALVRSVSHVAVLDLGIPTSRDLSVPLSTPDDPASVVPEQVELTTGGEGQDAVVWAFLRAPASADLFALRIVHNPAYGKGDEPSLSVNLNVYFSGQTPSDMLVLEGGVSPRVLVVNRTSATVALIDAVTAEVTAIPLGGPADRALRTEPDAGRDLVLLYDLTSGSTAFHVLDLDAVSAGKGKTVRTYKVASPISSAEILPGSLEAVVSHGYGSGTGGLSIIDLESGDVVPFTSTGQVVGTAPATGGHMLIATNLNGVGYLVDLDLATLHPETTQLVGVPQGIAMLAGSNRLAIDMAGARGGLLTLWPKGKVDSGSATLVGGFLAQGLLDREEWE